MHRRNVARTTSAVRPTAFAGWVAGAPAATVIHYGVPAYAEAIAGILAAAGVYTGAEFLRGSVGPLGAPAAREPELAAEE